MITVGMAAIMNSSSQEKPCEVLHCAREERALRPHCGSVGDTTQEPSIDMLVKHVTREGDRSHSEHWRDAIDDHSGIVIVVVVVVVVVIGPAAPACGLALRPRSRGPHRHTTPPSRNRDRPTETKLQPTNLRPCWCDIDVLCVVCCFFVVLSSLLFLFVGRCFLLLRVVCYLLFLVCYSFIRCALCVGCCVLCFVRRMPYP